MDDGFRFAYDPGVIRYGSGCVAELAAELEAQGRDRALVVCGRTVGDTPAVVDPVRAGLGDRLAGVFARTTPDKRLSTAIEGAKRLRETGADTIVALGGGSSLDVAKAMRVVAASANDPAALGATFEAEGTLPVPAGTLPGLFVVPTTLAGADLSTLAGLTASPETCPVSEPVSGGVGDPRLMPSALFYDPGLVATTPRRILAASAMNGFDKGVESLYARNRTPVTDATATRGLELLREGLPTLAGDRGEWDTGRVLRGIVLVQYGISRPDGTTLSLIHAFGHGLTAHSDIQQGGAHAVVAPHALAFLFERVDGRRELLADALGADGDPARGVVRTVREIRDALGLPAGLREAGIERSTLDAMAETTAEDSLLDNAPEGLDPTVADLRGVLERAW